MNQVCPLDGTKFVATLDMSGTAFGQQLDAKKTGPTASPWALAVCPKDHFVLYQDEYSKAEIADLKKFVASDDYQKWVKDNPSYFLLAKLFEHVGKDKFAVGFAYLQASWQVDTEPVPYRRAALESLDAFKKWLELPGSKDPERVQSAELFSGELERRLGDFDPARARFERLKKTKGYDTGVYARIVRYQLELIAAHDSEAHQVPSEQEDAGQPPSPKKP